MFVKKSHLIAIVFGSSILTILFCLLSSGLSTDISFVKQLNHSIVVNAVSSQATASISAVPSSGTYNQGDTFQVVIHIDGGGQAFNAASANISVSSDLSIRSVDTSINQSSTGCHFTFITDGKQADPTPSSSGFAGAILSGQTYPAYSTGCDVMTLTLHADSSGAGSALDINNGNVESYPVSPSDQPSSIYASAIDGSYNIINGSSNPPGNPPANPPNNPSSNPPSNPPVCNNRPDLNGDGKINVLDLSMMLRNWRRPGITDLNCDGTTDVLDLSILLRAWSR